MVADGTAYDAHDLAQYTAALAALHQTPSECWHHLLSRAANSQRTTHRAPAGSRPRRPRGAVSPTSSCPRGKAPNPFDRVKHGCIVLLR